jgi:hypothetical protein
MKSLLDINACANSKNLRRNVERPRANIIPKRCIGRHAPSNLGMGHPKEYFLKWTDLLVICCQVLTYRNTNIIPIIVGCIPTFAGNLIPFFAGDLTILTTSQFSGLNTTICSCQF